MSEDYTVGGLLQGRLEPNQEENPSFFFVFKEARDKSEKIIGIIWMDDIIKMTEKRMKIYDSEIVTDFLQSLEAEQ